MTRAWPRYAGSEDLAAVEEIPWSERGMPTSVYAAVREAAATRPDAVAHRTMRDGASWGDPVVRTFGEHLAQVNQLGNLFTHLGVSRRDVVGLLSVNTAELVPALLAAESVAIAAPLNPALAKDDLGSLLRRAGARVLVAAGPELDPGIWATARELAAELELDAVLAMRPTGASVPAPDLEAVPGVLVAHLADVADEHAADRLLAGEPGPMDLAAFFHTGGTTGTPKLAAHTHRMQVIDAWSVAVGIVDEPDASFFAALPLFHVNALIVTTLAPMLRAQPVVWAGPLGYRDGALLGAFWRIVERYGVAGMSGVPTVYNALCQVPVDADISSLSQVIVGAAPLPIAVADRWLAQAGIPLCEGYGLTEATCASARSFVHESRPGHVGQRFPYQEIRAVRIDHETGEPVVLEPGEVGTVQIRGPVVFPGYVVGRNQDGPVLDTIGKVHDGWLDTGDLGAVTADGWLRLVGRAKDVIIRGGHNIDPVPIEQVLLAHPGVVDAGVVGRPDRRSGEVPMAFVVVRDPDLDLDELRRWAADRVHERAAAPTCISPVSALPVTAVGKPDKVALRVLATRAELAPALESAGVSLPADGAWCSAHDGAVRVRLALDDPWSVVAERILSRYGLDWAIVRPTIGAREPELAG